MTLALVQATVAIILTMVATWTGLLVSVAFLLPRSASKAEHLMTNEPWKCFFRGLGMAVLMVLGFIVFSVGAPPIKIFAVGVLMFVGALIAVGSAGVAQTIGRRGEPDGTAPTFGMLVRGSLVFSLALGFPFVGWLVFAPLALVTAAGAGLMAMIPERRTAYTPPAAPGSSDYDLSGRTGIIS
jgi:hypothetical protein